MFTQYRQMTQAAGLESSVVDQALKEELQVRRSTEAELDQLFQSLQKDVNEGEQQSVQSIVLAKLNTDLTLNEKLNQHLKSPQYKVGINLTFPLDSNKMSIAFKGAIDLITYHFPRVLSGNIPGHRYKTEPNEITVLGDEGDNTTIWGNSKGTFLKTAALLTHLVSNKKDRLSEASFLPGKETFWVDRSSMVHVTTLPSILDLVTLDASFVTFSCYFSDPITKQGYSYIHSEYAFGGDRHKTRPAKPNQLVPNDCSSKVAEWLKSSIPITTDDLLYHYRITQGEFLNPAVRKWQATAREPKLLAQLMTGIKIKDPQKDIRPGQVYCHRGYDAGADPTFENTKGAGGHTALVTGFISDGKNSKILTIGCNRDMPKMEGFGLQAFPLEPKLEHPRGRKVMLFSINGLEADGKNAALVSAAAADVASVMEKFAIKP